ncbi:MAG TPA: 1-deoxy-D-xylulose-5-phosphate reductoisomerase [Actinomycetota bacterium]
MGSVKRIAILGSTGSIGTQALDVVRKHPDRFQVAALVAGSNAELLSQQVDEFKPRLAGLAASRDGNGRFAHGPQVVLEAAALPDADVVVNALVGSRGLVPTITALEHGKTVALANKESLVAGGEIVMRLVRDHPERLLPVDSEHSAIFQCLAGNRLGDVRRVILTASGGPFRGRDAASLRGVTPAEALKHPTWLMGKRITIDSATLVNKGLEAIEAHHLFRIPIDRVEIVVHPQSIVHGIVEYSDGSSIAQASTPDMRLPLQVALSWPERFEGGAEPLDWAGIGALAFEPLDADVFPAPRLAMEAARRGGTYPCVFNAADEEAVAAFLDGRLDFPGIVRVIDEVLGRHAPEGAATLEAVLDAEEWARSEARSIIE